ncbi:hypothetical protein C0J52_25153, partial [Blattella germanica]
PGLSAVGISTVLTILSPVNSALWRQLLGKPLAHIGLLTIGQDKTSVETPFKRMDICDEHVHGKCCKVILCIEWHISRGGKV